MSEHKMCPACGSEGRPIVNEGYGFQILCRNPKCLVRGPSRPVMAKAWKAWDDPCWRTPSWGEEVHDLKVNLDLANGMLDWARKDLEHCCDKLELARLERDEWRDRYEDLVTSAVVDRRK